MVQNRKREARHREPLRAPGDWGPGRGSPGSVSQTGLADPSSSPAKLLGLLWPGSRRPYKRRLLLALPQSQLEDHPTMRPLLVLLLLATLCTGHLE